MFFTTTTHNLTIYISFYKPTGDTIYTLWQVDDFSLAYFNESAAKDVYDQIGDALQLPGESDKPFSYLGLVTDFNGIYIEQSCGYTQIYSPNYINRVMLFHLWNGEKSNFPAKLSSHLPPDSHKQLFSHNGPKEGTKEHKELDKNHGLNYITVLL